MSPGRSLAGRALAVLLGLVLATACAPPPATPSGGVAGAAAPDVRQAAAAATEGPAPARPAGAAPATAAGVRATTADDARGVPLPQLRHRSARLADVDRRARGETADRVPLRLRVPSIGVDARVASVGVDGATGQMAVPPNGATTGWYRHGASPGAPGSAVVAGHVDYAGAPGVFFRLRELGAGERVEVVYDDGSREAFTVTGAQSYTKASLPVDELFARHGGPVLALVTCGGPFDARVRHYRDNLVVRAEPSP